jgi:hypothetical protein
LLASSGLVLNHSSGLALDRRFLDSEWLLEWYGFERPSVAKSFLRGSSYAALIDDRVFVNGRELARGASDLTGLVATGATLAITTDRELLLANAAGELLDRLRIEAIEAVGTQQEQIIVVRTVTGLEAYRGDALVPLAVRPSGTIDWAEPAPLPAALTAELERAYRGPGLTLERLIYDLHSGRLLGLSGTLLMDAVAVIAVFLAVTGLVIWLKPRA